jgi:hypothetical protein
MERQFVMYLNETPTQLAVSPLEVKLADIASNRSPCCSNRLDLAPAKLRIAFATQMARQQDFTFVSFIIEVVHIGERYRRGVYVASLNGCPDLCRGLAHGERIRQEICEHDPVEPIPFSWSTLIVRVSRCDVGGLSTHPVGVPELRVALIQRMQRVPVQQLGQVDDPRIVTIQGTPVVLTHQLAGQDDLVADPVNAHGRTLSVQPDNSAPIRLPVSPYLHRNHGGFSRTLLRMDMKRACCS